MNRFLSALAACVLTLSMSAVYASNSNPKIDAAKNPEQHGYGYGHCKNKGKGHEKDQHDKWKDGDECVVTPPPPECKKDVITEEARGPKTLLDVDFTYYDLEEEDFVTIQGDVDVDNGLSGKTYSGTICNLSDLDFYIADEALPSEPFLGTAAGLSPSFTAATGLVNYSCILDGDPTGPDAVAPNLGWTFSLEKICFIVRND